MTPRVYSGITQGIGQKRAVDGTAAGGGGALPPPIGQEATLAQADSFMGRMMKSDVGQQMLMQVVTEDSRYTPPHMRQY